MTLLSAISKFGKDPQEWLFAMIWRDCLLFKTNRINVTKQRDPQPKNRLTIFLTRKKAYR